MTREKERNYKLLRLIEPVLRMNQDQLEKLQVYSNTKFENMILVLKSSTQTTLCLS